MLRLTVSPEEYLMIGDNIKIVFLGGTKNYLRIMVDAPKNVNILRSAVLEAKEKDPARRAAMPKYYREPEWNGSEKGGAKTVDTETETGKPRRPIIIVKGEGSGK